MLPYEEQHVYIGDGATLRTKMTKCNPAGVMVGPSPISVADMIRAFVQGNLQEHFVYEDGPGYVGGDYWVTGNQCRAPK
jgi:hypothetical protein